MTAFSRHVARATCAQVVHPWNDNCSRAYLTMIRSSIFGGCKMFLPIVLIELTLKLWKNKKLETKLAREFLNDFIEFMAMGTCLCTTFIVNNCIIRYILGKYTYMSVVFAPGFFAGFSYLIFTPKRRIQVFPAIVNAALESILLTMSNSGLIRLDVFTETLFFMITNACLMYVSRTLKSNNPNYTWFYTPEVYDPDMGKKLFLETIYKKMKNYFGLGVGFGILRTLIGDVTVLAPKNLHRLFKMRILKVGIFGASYVAVYELIVYFVNRYFGENRPVSALPAGFLAGLSYAIEPNLSINLSAFINLIQLLYKLVDARLLKHYVSVDIIMFGLSIATLFHIQLFYPKSMSKFGSNFIRGVSNNKANVIAETIRKLMCSAI